MGPSSAPSVNTSPLWRPFSVSTPLSDPSGAAGAESGAWAPSGQSPDVPAQNAQDGERGTLRLASGPGLWAAGSARTGRARPRRPGDLSSGSSNQRLHDVRRRWASNGSHFVWADPAGAGANIKSLADDALTNCAIFVALEGLNK